MKQVDLHVHTTASDGTDTPAQVVEQAHALGLSAVAITDHDTVSGIAEAQQAGQRLGIEVIPGIEISADYKGERAHIVGLFLDPDAEALLTVTQWAVSERRRRNEKIVTAMQFDGIDISMDALRAANPDSVIGRPHIADRLVQLGMAESVSDAFDKYLLDGRPYYRDKERISLEGAADCIRAAGGIAIIAHPLQYGYQGGELDAYIRTALEAGCIGFEAYYSEHSAGEQAALLALAEQLHVHVSGGSDYHGSRKPHIRLGSGIGGTLAVPASVLEDLRTAAGK